MTILSFASRYDAIIVGARCAGAATAMLLARAGLRILVVERDQPGTDTMSTHALMRGAVMQLDRWGLLGRIRAAGTPAVRRTSFIYGEEAVHVDIRPEAGVDALYAPRRTVLDHVLVTAAAGAGAELRFGVAFADVMRDAADRVRGAVLQGPGGERFEVAADIVIGADGRRSRVARAVGAEALKTSRHAAAAVYAYFAGLENRGYRWYFQPGVTAGVIPTNRGESCVFLGLPRERFLTDVRGHPETGLRAGLASAFPALDAELRNAEVRSRATGFAGERGHVRRSQGAGWALVGDAGYFKDPQTAHGITDALRDAEILARAIVSGGGDAALARYVEERDALSADLFAVTDEIAGLDWDLQRMRGLHLELNSSMKAEQAWISGLAAGPFRRAA